MQPRPYQSDVIAAVETGWEEASKQLIVVPTGGGKTIIFSHLSHRRDGRTLILAHREELIDQAIEKLCAATGITAEKEKAEFSASLDAKVVVASIQSMQRRLDKWPANHFNLVVCDEAHHVLSDSWQQVLRHFDGAADVLGVTATPDRGDKKNLGKYFERIATEVKLVDLINDGYLSPIAIQSVPLEIDLRAVKSIAGDFSDSDLGHALEPYLDRIASAIVTHARYRRTLAFLPLIATSQKFVVACCKAGLRAEHVDGESSDRREKLESFDRGEFDLLSNAMLLTEGYDSPGIDCVVVLRPTRSRPLYAQMCGRGTRIADFKENLLLLDFLWLHESHSISRPANLVVETDVEADVITDATQARALPGDVAAQIPLDLLELATDTQAQREKALREKLAQQSKKKGKFISAEEFAISHNSLAVAEYEPVMAWEKKPITEDQSKYLKRIRIDVATVNGRGHATQLLNVWQRNQKLVLASPKQRSLMGRMGHANAATATAKEAAKFFAELKTK